jgi:phage virion morphogenesis protein
MPVETLDGLEEWMRMAIEAMAPRRRQSLFRDIARSLRKRNQSRLTKQTGPDGDKWPARVRAQGRDARVRDRKKMMMGLRQARRMAIDANPDGSTIGWSGRDARIARIHHYGMKDRPSPGARQVRYPVRQLIGLADGDLELIRDRVMAHLESAFD